jgi:hypothetical protein
VPNGPGREVVGSNKQEAPMFDSVLSQLSNLARNAARAIRASTHHTPWLVSAVLAALFLIW